eukprot:511433_1
MICTQDETMGNKATKSFQSILDRTRDKYEAELKKCVASCLMDMNATESENTHFPHFIIQIMIEYIRVYVDLHINDDHIKNTVQCKSINTIANNLNFMINIKQTTGFVLKPAISDLDNGSIDVIHFGIQSFKSKNNTKPASLLLEHNAKGNFPTAPNSIRYDSDGEVVNYKAKLRPRLATFTFEDIISVEVIFSDKTIEYFKNGESILKSKICFGYPWYFGLWPDACKVLIIQDESQLLQIRQKPN